MDAYQAERALMLNDFAATLRELRKQRFSSQEALAEAASLHRTHVGYLEQGRREPSLATLLILADALDVPVARLAQGLAVPKERRPPPPRKSRRA